MIILTYDIQNDKLRTRFSKFITQYGRRLQYSVYEINNSERVLNLIEIEIKNVFAAQFSQRDSVLIFRITDSSKILRYGYAKNEETDLVII